MQYSILQIRYADRRVLKSYVFDDFEQYGIPDEPIDMDYSFWVLQSADRIILFDTGYDLPERNLHDEVSVISPPDALAALGITPEQVSMVVVSHFHFDHIGYLGLFSQATIVAGRGERTYWFDLWKSGRLEGTLASAAHLSAVERAEDEGRLVLVDEPAEVVEGVTVYPVSGHSPGELLCRVNTASGSFILASDAAHFYEQSEWAWPFFAFTDRQQMIDGYHFVQALAAETGSIVVPGHDGRTRDRFPLAEGEAGAFATRIA